MTCSTPGCYAKAFRRNLCRNHFYAWRDQLPAAAPVDHERGLRANPAPWTYYCSCVAPMVMPTGLIPGAVQCQRCGKPPLDPRKEDHEAV